MFGRVLGLVAAAFVLGGCPSEPFGCENDEQCQVDAAAGTCEFNGYCSFPDPDCPSGRRYSNLAGGGLGGLCVNAPEETTGTGTSTGPATTSSSPMTGLTTALTSGPGDSSTGSPGDGSSSTSSGPASTGSSEASSGTTGGIGLDDGLVVYVSFEDNTDDEGNLPAPGSTLPAACDLVGGACPEFIEDGVIGRAGRFDGANDIVLVQDDPRLHLGDQFALAFWSRRTGPIPAFAIIAGKAYGDGDLNSYEVYVNNANDADESYRVLFSTDSPTVSAIATEQVTNDWTHVAGVRDGDEWRLYVDGSLVQLDLVDGDIAYDERPFSVGGDTANGALAHFFPGEIDEVRLYDRALSIDEVMQLATAR